MLYDIVVGMILVFIESVLIFCCILMVLCRDTIPLFVTRPTFCERSLLLCSLLHMFDRGNEVTANKTVSPRPIANGFEGCLKSIIIQFLNRNKKGLHLKLIFIVSSNI
jgi:hypothetical protein